MVSSPTVNRWFNVEFGSIPAYESRVLSKQMSRALAPVALMHLSSIPSEHPFMLDVVS